MKSSTQRRKTYHAYLRSEAWQKKRQEVWDSRRHMCTICRKTGIPLDVHHLTYRNQGNEKPEDLTLLCRPCHTEVHRVARARKIDLGTNHLREVTSYVRQQYFLHKKHPGRVTKK